MILNGQRANQTNFNAAFVSRTAAQTVAGGKEFQDYIAVNKQDIATAASITAMAVAKSFTKFTGSTATSVHGITASVNGFFMILYNASSAVVTLKHQSVTASAANRLNLGADFTLDPNQGVILAYDATAARWVLGSNAVGDHTVTNAKLAQIATARFKGRVTAGTGDVEDLTATQATSLLNVMVGDSGSGGTKGMVPAPSAGDAAAGKFLKADGSFAVPPGTGGGNMVDDVFSGDNSTTAFTLSVSPGSIDNTWISISGVLQNVSTYTIVGTTLTFSVAPPTGTNNIQVKSGTTLSVGTPSNGTVGRAQANIASLFPVPKFFEFLTTGSGSYTPTAGCLYFEIEMVGEGGSGGGSGTVGSPGGDGSNGANTTFDTMVAGGGLAGGGTGGAAAGGDGGTNSLGGYTTVSDFKGSSGQSGMEQVSVSGQNFHPGGMGGPSPYLGVGSSASGGNGLRDAAANSGAGGAGAGTGGVGSQIAGSGGGSGGYLKGFIINTGGPYTYSIGENNANGGTAGTSGYPGAKAGTGRIRIVEHFQ